MAEGIGQSGIGGGAAPATATARYGVYNQHLPIVGKTVSEARAMLAELWAVPKDAVAMSGKNVLADDYKIKAGDSIEFQRRTGEKGAQ